MAVVKLLNHSVPPILLSSPEAEPEMRLMGKWFVKDVLPATTGKGGDRTGEARVWFQARSKAQPGQQGALGE